MPLHGIMRFPNVSLPPPWGRCHEVTDEGERTIRNRDIQTLYCVDAVVPTSPPIQSVWKNCPRSASIRS